MSNMTVNQRSQFERAELAVPSTGVHVRNPRRLAIFSNGSPAMLKRLVAHAGIGALIETVISADEIGVYKPDPRGYAHVEKRLGLAREDILFVSSNGFDIAGAKAHGFPVARIERLSSERLRVELAAAAVIDPALMFKALRLQPEQLGFHADVAIAALTDLASYVAGLEKAQA